MRWFLKEDDGEAESAKSEMIVASSVLCDLTPHCFVIFDRRDRGVDSMLYTVHASKHGRKRRDVAFFYSFNQSIRELRFHPLQKKYTSVMIRVCHSWSRFLSCMYIHARIKIVIPVLS